MVQIISENRRPEIPKVHKPSMAERLKSAGATGIQIGLETLLGNEQKREAQKQLQIEDESAARIGANLKGIRDPKQRQQILASALQAKRDEESTQRKFKNQMGLQEDKYKRESDLLSGRGAKEAERDQLTALEDERAYGTIKKMFGPKAADLYRASPTGAKTAIISQLLESNQRGLDVDSLLGKGLQEGEPDEMAVKEGPSKAFKGPAMKTTDFDKGLTPKERASRQEKRYSTNLPLYQESQKKKEALEAAEDRLNIMQQLSPQIGTLERLNINAATGELLVPALASEEAQRFVKTLNDFTTSAKDSFGGRVTNFDLDRFMKRLPSLANSESAREEIIRQMQIINDVNLEKEKALQEVIKEHGGIRNIDFDEAGRLAEKKAKPRVDQFRSLFKAIDKHLDEELKDTVKQKKRDIPKGFIGFEKDGKIFFADPKNMKKALERGYKKV